MVIQNVQYLVNTLDDQKLWIFPWLPQKNAVHIEYYGLSINSRQALHWLLIWLFELRAAVTKIKSFALPERAHKRGCYSVPTIYTETHSFGWRLLWYS